MTKIINPILPGFNPDPSFLRVGDDYYIATSTFEWFPGVQIHHSKDLKNWRLLTRPLDRVSQLDMTGVNNSCGIWAPALSYHDNTFWLVYTNVQSCRGGSWMNTPNYVVTAEKIEGPWSEPTFLNATGFDPSLFHDDDDGKTYLLNMVWDGREDTNYFGGIMLQEFDTGKMELLGTTTKIFDGSTLGSTEGPFLLKKDGWYFLITAEGGTNFSHAVTVCRSRNITGPYELHPQNPILTSHHKDDAPLQRTGHGFIQQAQSGEWYLTHLCGRPLQNPEGKQNDEPHSNSYSILGRETAIQKIKWDDDAWPRLACGGNTPELEVQAPNLPEHPWPSEEVNDTFDGITLNKHFQTLRQPIDESWCSLKERKGYLRLRGRQSLFSNFQQSMVARRIQAFTIEAETCLEFSPENFQQMAGLIVYYNNRSYYYLRITQNSMGQKSLGIVQSIDDRYGEHPESEVIIHDLDTVYLKVVLDHEWYQFQYSVDGEKYTNIGPKLNSTKLSDEAGDVFRFTGTFVGLSAIDVTGAMYPADFKFFKYSEG